MVQTSQLGLTALGWLRDLISLQGSLWPSIQTIIDRNYVHGLSEAVSSNVAESWTWGNRTANKKMIGKETYPYFCTHYWKLGKWERCIWDLVKHIYLSILQNCKKVEVEDKGVIRISLWELICLSRFDLGSLELLVKKQKICCFYRI